jgi:preprotein translocase subunit SecA
MHYMVQVPALEPNEDGSEPERPAGGVAELQEAAKEAGLEAYERKLAELDDVKDETDQGYGERLLALVMLNVLDEKWKDHLYDLDQLRSAIHYRSWGQKDPLVEYKGEAYTMFVDLMHDVADTFTDRFLKAQIQFGGADDGFGGFDDGFGDFGGSGRSGLAALPPQIPTKRYNAFGILEDIPADELLAMLAQLEGNGANGNGHGPDDEIVEASYDDDGVERTGQALDVGPSEPPDVRAVSKPDPAI